MTHKTVPVEPTEEMRNAGWDAFNSSESIAEDFYEMVKAAPPSPVTELERELRAALWHIKNTAASLADAQVIALEALSAYEAKKEGK